MNSKPINKRINTEQGFTLIEVLVAALILGVGLLGIVTFQSKALQYNQQAYYYSQASFFAYDIADRMRANPDAVDQYEVDFDIDPSSTATKCLTGDCTELEFAAWDLKVWKDTLATALPNGDGEVVKIGDQFVITTQFTDPRDPDTPVEVSVSIQI